MSQGSLFGDDPPEPVYRSRRRAPVPSPTPDPPATPAARACAVAGCSGHTSTMGGIDLTTIVERLCFHHLVRRPPEAFCFREDEVEEAVRISVEYFARGGR